MIPHLGLFLRLGPLQSPVSLLRDESETRVTTETLTTGVLVSLLKNQIPI